MRSENYKNWVARLDPKTCKPCEDNHGKVYEVGRPINPRPPLHPNDRCRIEWLGAVEAGTATYMGNDGADFWLKWCGRLPDYYITEQQALELGYKPRRSILSDYAPGKMITMGVYQNRNGHLPDAPGRIWYEVDINYYGGKRGTDRILCSNDGLIFVTYDHYLTFQEVVA